MRSYSRRLYRVEDSVVNYKAIQTYSAWRPEGQHVTEPWRPGTGTGGLLVRTEVPHSNGGDETKWRNHWTWRLSYVKYHLLLILKEESTLKSKCLNITGDELYSVRLLSLFHLLLLVKPISYCSNNDPREHVKVEASTPHDVMPQKLVIPQSKTKDVTKQMSTAAHRTESNSRSVAGCV